MDVPFTRREHPIPESLGNDDWILPPGFVCDICNQYFGSKVEHKVISEPPFVMERLGFVVKSKKGRMPVYKAGPGLQLLSSGHADTLLVAADEKYLDYYRSKLRRKSFMIIWDGPKAFYLSRFLLKIGLETLLTSSEGVLIGVRCSPNLREAGFPKSGMANRILDIPAAP